MLKVSGRQDARLPPKPGKAPVLIRDLLNLYQFLSGKGPKSEAVRDIAIIAFWGMARLAEVRYLTKKGPIPYKSRLTVAEVKRYKIATTLTLHEAKTAKPGETQLLKLRPMKGPLCP
jgi:hypothetical protein